MLDQISLCHRTLLDDQYGNYVIQHVLQFGRVKDRDVILDMVVENGLLKLSRQKFASNVVEKLLKYGNADQRKAVVREMLRVVDDQTGTFVENAADGTSVVLLMVRDAYANYVVQTTLDVIPESEEKILLLKELNLHSSELVSSLEEKMPSLYLVLNCQTKSLTTIILPFPM
jgi:pumilio RNA-binding family